MGLSTVTSFIGDDNKDYFLKLSDIVLIIYNGNPIEQVEGFPKKCYRVYLRGIKGEVILDSKSGRECLSAWMNQKR